MRILIPLENWCDVNRQKSYQWFLNEMKEYFLIPYYLSNTCCTVNSSFYFQRS